jgi:uncharacterized protein (TIGR03000 family)
MIRRTLLLSAPVLAAILVLTLPASSAAQMMTIAPGGRGGYSGGWSGYSPGYSSGWVGYYPGYASGWSGYPSPGYGSYYSPGYSYYSYPRSAYYNYPYYSSYAYPGNNYYYSRGSIPSGYQSFYPSDAGDNRVAYVRVQVPPYAEVWIEGTKTQQTGSNRLFVSPPLDSNGNYTYTVKARWIANGQEVTRSKSVPVRAGEEASVTFPGAE